MRITEKKLRQIIREEKRRLAEGQFGDSSGSALIDFARAYSSLGGAVTQQVDSLVEAWMSVNGDETDVVFEDAVYGINPSALDMALGKLKRVLTRGDLGDEGSTVLEALEAAQRISAGGGEAEMGRTPPGISFPGLDD